MMNKKTLLMAIAALTVACAPLGKYKDDTTETVTDDLYGRGVELTDSSMARLGWKEIFTEPNLQLLIQAALDSNVDLMIAYEKVQQAEAILLGAKLAYVPQLGITGGGGYNGGLIQGNDNNWNSTQYWNWNAGLSLSWEIDIFGRIENRKKAASATVAQMEDQRQAVRVSLISAVANNYYALLMLDEELRTSMAMEEVWKESVDAIHALKKEGFADEVAVSQYEATYSSLKATSAELRQQIRITENAMSVLLGKHCFSQDRTILWNVSIPKQLEVGVPIELLTYRPDVRAAQRGVEVAFYNTKEAWLNFFPKLTLDGTAVLTNIVNGSVVPLGFLGNIGANLVAPVLSKGQNKAKLREAESRQREARLTFDKTMLVAGQEVNDALASIAGCKEKFVHYSDQTKSLVKAREDTELLMYNSQDKTYLDVLMAHNALIEAEFNGIATYAEGLQAVVQLYAALGGGSEY